MKRFYPSRSSRPLRKTFFLLLSYLILHTPAFAAADPFTKLATDLATEVPAGKVNIGVGNTLTRATAILAACFFATSIALTMLTNQKGGSSIVNQVQTQPAPAGKPWPQLRTRRSLAVARWRRHGFRNRI